MSSKDQKMMIEFSAEQTKKYFEIVSSRTTAELDEDCIPSGATIEIAVIPPFGCHASVNGQDLGEISLEIIEL